MDIMPITSVPSKMKSIDHATGFKEFQKQFHYFCEINNLLGMECVMHILNSFYFMSPDLDKGYKNDNDTPKDQRPTQSS